MTVFLASLPWSAVSSIIGVNVKPKFLRIIVSDFSCTAAVLVPVVCWALYLIAEFAPTLLAHAKRGTSPPPSSYFLWGSIFCSGICLPALILRVFKIRRHFARGEIVEGVITNVVYVKDRGRLEYFYDYAGMRYHSGNAIHQNKKTRGFWRGQPVKLVVNKENPKNAFVKSIYVD